VNADVQALKSPVRFGEKSGLCGSKQSAKQHAIVLAMAFALGLQSATIKKRAEQPFHPRALQ
jgi:hypothetical protein